MNQQSGEGIIFEGEDILHKNRKEMRKLREKMQFIFQDPYSSLNPRMNVFNILSEPLIAHGIYKRGPELEEYIKNLMENVDFQAITVIVILTSFRWTKTAYWYCQIFGIKSKIYHL